MKKTIFLMLAILALSVTVNAQWKTKNSKTYLYPYSGYVGIGTDAPTVPLEVKGTVRVNTLYINGSLIAPNNLAVADTGADKKVEAYYHARTTYAPLANPTFTTKITTPVATITTTDTASGSYPVGSLFMRITGSDTSMWVKIRMTGTKAARWKKLTP